MVGYMAKPLFFEVTTGKPSGRKFPTVNQTWWPGRGWNARTLASRRGIVVFRGEDFDWGITLGIDQPTLDWPLFSPDGKYLTWEGLAGDVMVCNLEKTARRLKEVGLGWR